MNAAQRRVSVVVSGPVLLAALGGLSGCGALPVDRPVFGASRPVAGQSWAAGVALADVPRLAAVAGETLAASLPRAATTIAVRPAGGPLGAAAAEAIAAALRERGFAVASGGIVEPGVRSVGFRIAASGSDLLFRLNVDGSVMDCLYARDGGELGGGGSCSVRNGGAVALVGRGALGRAGDVRQQVLAAAAPSRVAMADAGGDRPAANPTRSTTPLGASVRPAVVAQEPEPSQPPSVVAALARAGKGVVPTPKRVARTEAATGAEEPTPRSVAVVVASATPAAAAAADRRWTVAPGQLVGSALVGWGRQSGWTVVWQVPVDWPSPLGAEFTGTFEKAAEGLIVALHDGGADIRARAFRANRTLVVSSNDNAR